ncbi:MAG TPA: universal stress protein [Tepidisphaeraceae bacterium]|jgi:nucleotide-binding universal stress UspA family protein
MEKILAFLDFSEDLTPALLKAACELADGLRARLILLHVAVPIQDDERLDDETADSQWTPGDAAPWANDRGGGAAARALASAHRRLQIIELELKRQGIDATTTLIRGEPSRRGRVKQITQEMERLAPDLIVLGSHGHGPIHDLFVGGVAEVVVRRAQCPVLLVPRKPA